MRRGLLVPFDGSENATEALRVAIGLAKSLGEKLIVLNVQLNFRTIHTKMFFNEKTIQEYQQQLFQEAVEPVKTMLQDSGVEYEVKLRIGDAKEQIVLEAGGETAHQPGCSDTGVKMIIMGSRGMSPILGSVLGSVSHAVVNMASCPVTIVPFSCFEPRS